MIVVNGNEFRTLEDPIYVNGRRVSRVLVNGKQVYPNVAGAIVLKKPPDRLEYAPGDKLDYTGIEVALVYQGGGEEVSIPFEELIFPVKFIPFSVDIPGVCKAPSQDEVGIVVSFNRVKGDEETRYVDEWVYETTSRYPMCFYYIANEDGATMLWIQIHDDKRYSVNWVTGGWYDTKVESVVGDPIEPIKPIKGSDDLKAIAGAIVRAIINAYESTDEYMDIPVLWERPEDEEMLELSFQVKVTSE